MLWCAHCRDLIPPTRDNYFTSCSVCGKVLYQSVITTEPALVKNCGIKKRRAGSSVIVKSISSDHSQSSKRTLNKEAAQKILKKEHGNVGGAADCKPHVGNQENVYDCSYDGDDEDDHN
ncbi:hypothetical protein C1H46_043338 [Malus baccata]|uniref:Uncharacterized protein n=1 Tax=Malus baccata TaxID=106549 RepID=A0A540KAA0_MALBA|nr:hypothetical protein C1H46_043338 [Malus baccata]